MTLYTRTKYGVCVVAVTKYLFALCKASFRDSSSLLSRKGDGKESSRRGDGGVVEQAKTPAASAVAGSSTIGFAWLLVGLQSNNHISLVDQFALHLGIFKTVEQKTMLPEHFQPHLGVDRSRYKIKIKEKKKESQVGRVSTAENRRIRRI